MFFTNLNNDVSNYIFSFLKNYGPILRLVNKNWNSKFLKYKKEFRFFFDEIITRNELNVLKYISKFKNLSTNRICEISSLKGNLEILKWARENNCPWDESTCSHAARGGHLEILKWARENGCPWDENTCSYAAFGGHLEILKWARANDCPWSERTCACAAEGGDRKSVV